MAFLLGPLLGGLASSLFGSSSLGLQKVKDKRKLVVIHEGELVAPKRLANKLRKDPKYKSQIEKLPKTPQRLKKADKKYLSSITSKVRRL